MAHLGGSLGSDLGGGKSSKFKVSFALNIFISNSECMVIDRYSRFTYSLGALVLEHAAIETPAALSRCSIDGTS